MNDTTDRHIRKDPKIVLYLTESSPPPLPEWPAANGHTKETCAILCVAVLRVGGMSALLNVGLNVGVLCRVEKCCFHLRPHTNIFPFLLGPFILVGLD
jgi:hypothetical protein